MSEELKITFPAETVSGCVFLLQGVQAGLADNGHANTAQAIGKVVDSLDPNRMWHEWEKEGQP